METRHYIIFLLCLFPCALKIVKGTYFVYPKGRYEIKEIPLPSSVIAKIKSKNSPFIGAITPTGVLIGMSSSASAQKPQPTTPGPPKPCPRPAACPCPCPHLSANQTTTTPGNPAYLRPLSKSIDGLRSCPSLCICLCIDAFHPPPVTPPQVPVAGPKPFESRPPTPRLKPQLLGLVPGPRPVSLQNLQTAVFAGVPAAASSTPPVQVSQTNPDNNAITNNCTGTGCVSASRNPAISATPSSQTTHSTTSSSATVPPMIPPPAPAQGAPPAAVIAPLIPPLAPGPVITPSSSKATSPPSLIPPLLPALQPQQLP